MDKRLIVALMMAAGTATIANAQSDDFGVWTGATVEKKINKKWTVELNGEFRSRDDLRHVDRWSVGGVAEYKIAKWLKADAGYEWLYDFNDKTKYNQVGNLKTRATYFGVRHRFRVSLSGDVDFGALNVSLRERWQYTYRPERTTQRWDVDNEEYEPKTYNGKGKNVWRNRLQLKYKVSKRVKPYVSAESFVADGLDEMRYAAGVDLKLSKQHSIDVGYKYLYVGSNADNDPNRHIISVGYTYSF